MQKVMSTTPNKVSMLEVTPNQLREIANNMEKESQSAESKEMVTVEVTSGLSFIYKPQKKMDSIGYGSNREEPAYVPQNKSMGAN